MNNPITVGATFTLTYGINNADPLATAGTDITLGITLTDILGAVDTAGSVNAFTSADGTTETVTASSTSTDIFIDVTQGSTKFTGSDADYISDTEIIIGTVELADTGEPVVEDDGAAGWLVNGAAPGGDTDATVTLTITGPFAACVSGTGDVTLGGVSADTLTADTATWDLGNKAAFGSQNVNMKVDGTTMIPEGTPSATLAVNWDNDTYVDESITDDMRELKKNGSSDRLTFVLTPGGVYTNFVRISNPSGIAGDVFLTLINDAGDSVNFDLGDIAGVASNSLDSGASTSLINIDDIYAAAQAADPTFDYNGGKLRLRVEGEFGATGEDSGIVVNAFSMSTDGTTFNMMQ